MLGLVTTIHVIRGGWQAKDHESGSAGRSGV